MERIFVQIASYRDPECQWTLADMFEKAAHPDRIFAGICWQVDEVQDGSCFNEPCPCPSQVRTVFYSLPESRGLNWARAQAQSLWRGEEYVLQIHSHMRFAEGWDDILIETLKRCPSEKPVLSTCLPSYTPPGIFPYREETRASYMFVHDMAPGQQQILQLAGRLVQKEAPVPELMRAAFAVGSFLFARSELMHEVPFDPYIYYFGAELAYSARLWTHGWDIFQPDRYALFHWWGRTVSVPRPYRDIDNPRHPISHMRLRHLLRLEEASKSKAIEELDAYGLGSARTLDDYWEFSGIHPDKQQIAQYARDGMWNDAFNTWRAKPAAAQKRPRIFVQIASYRDPECQWTVKDIFDKAKYPDRISVGICWQYDPEEDRDCFRVSVRPEQVRIAPFHWKESQGVCWARYQVQQLYEGEDYTLMIDSHMRFAFDWDETLIKELDACPSQKAVLSNHPAAYTPPHDLNKNSTPSVLRSHPFSPEGDIRIGGGLLDKVPPRPLRGAFIAAGLIFTRGQMIREVPYDPMMYFNQEEISLALRLFTHGWDVYAPSKVVVYHCYNTESSRQKRPLHWSDNRDWGKLQIRARQRMDYLTGRDPSDDPEIIRDILKYGIGHERTIAEFEEYSGINFASRTANDRALRAECVEDLYVYKEHPMYVPELDKDKPPVSASLAAKGLMQGAPALAFPNPALVVKNSFDTMTLADGTQRKLNVDRSAPQGVLVIYDYIERSLCDALARYADSQSFTDLHVVDVEKTTDEKIATVKNSGRITTHVDIDGMVGPMLSIFNDIYCQRLAPFYNVNFEWYERPQILRYPPGGKYNQHADADHWQSEETGWQRVQDRDYSVLLYLNDEYEGGEIQLINQNFTVKPKPGMLLAFPSGHEYLHAALPTVSGLRYVIVSWAAILGSQRVRKMPPWGSVILRQKR